MDEKVNAYNSIAKLLGEENEKRLRDEVTDILIEHIRDELWDWDRYLFDWDEMFAQIYDEVCNSAKEKLTAKYMADLNKKLSEL